jgi:tRNA-specific 2-thiouridylase
MIVAVGMSGGVDSSTTAFLLKEKGFDVIGITLVLSDLKDGDCFSTKDIEDAKNVAKYLGIKHIVVDFRDIFKEKVINYFVNEYKRGLTPNPCSICNRDIKMGAMINFALNELKADKFATGHYAKLERDENFGLVIKRGKDKQKDQSYFLTLINKNVLDYLLFPLGDFTKEEVRQIAKENKLPVAEKTESFEICFTRGVSPSEYMLENKYISETEGDIIHISGKKLGKHKGLFKYTIGQRRGLGIRWKKPLYVIEKDIFRNAIIVGERKYLTTDKVIASNLNLLVEPEKWDKSNICIQGRYRQKCIRIKDFKIEDENITIQFNEPQERFAEGQILALYQDDILLGGGIISGNQELQIA